MDFDRRTILAFLLIGLILIIANTDFYKKLVDPKGYELRQQRLKEKQAQQIEEQEKVPAKIDKVESAEIAETTSEVKTESVDAKPVPLVHDADSTEKIIVIETSLYRATLSSRGASILQWELKNYPGVDGKPVKLFPPESYGTLGVSFLTQNQDSIALSNLNFFTDSPSHIELSGDKKTISFVLPIDEYRTIEKKYTFVDGVYDVGFQITFNNLSDLVAEKRFFLSAPNGLASTEKRLKDDMMYTKAGTSAGGEVDKKYKANGEPYNIDGVFDWVAVRTKYFVFYIIPESPRTASVEILGEQFPIRPGSRDKWKRYSLKMALPYLGQAQESNSFKLYLGPLEYDVLKKYDKNLQGFMDFGMSLIKPFSLGILIVFKWMHQFIPNYGIVLLIFAVLIKILVYPLTHKSYESMQKMQRIQPKLKELQEKYKSDPQKLNRATMEMYKKEGVNPMGGCLPMLLQMPLLFGLFIIFRTTIELRGQGFIFWITDLSAPDTIYTFPGNFSLPIYGNSVNILPLVMGVTMFFQQKMTVTDPKQKMMVYFMPIFLTLLFNSFPSGLNLYYALFNFLTILQQKYLTPKKVHVEEPTPARKKRRM